MQLKQYPKFARVDDHFEDNQIRDRSRLDLLTKELQVISYNANSHLGNADIAVINANSMKDAHKYLCSLDSPSETSEPGAVQRHPCQSTLDALNYLTVSMEKQKMWFSNYKDRKDTTMSLVYNLVTQQDASNNIEIAIEMRKDSGSMNAIAALTMLFLPGTFTATLLRAGIFSAEARSVAGVHVTHLWWVFLVVTIPLTATVITAWWIYQRWRAGKRRGAILQV